MKTLNVRMQVESVRLSGHADYNELIHFIKSIKGLKRIFLMHGEKEDLKIALEKDYQVIQPKMFGSYEL